MITRWKSALLLSIPIAMASPLRFGLSAEPDRDSVLADYHQTSAGQRNSIKKDLVTLHRDSNTLVMDVKRVTGIGGEQLHAPASGWPGNVLVRLHEFPDLESFTARTAKAVLDCARHRPDGIPSRLACRLGDAEIDAIRQEQGYFEVTLPPILLIGDRRVEIHWIDQWR